MKMESCLRTVVSRAGFIVRRDYSMQMKEILKKLIDSGKQDALNSLEEVTEAAKELGYSEKEIEEALDGFDGFPLD